MQGGVVPVVKAFFGGVKQLYFGVAYQVGHSFGIGRGQLCRVAPAAVQGDEGFGIGVLDGAEFGVGQGACACGHKACVVDHVFCIEHEAVLQDDQAYQRQNRADDGEFDHGAAALLLS